MEEEVKGTNYDIRKEANAILKYTLNLYNKGRFPMIKVLGHPGTGKSGCCIRLGELLNLRIHKKLEFNPDDIIDSFEGLIQKIMETKPEDKRIIIIEELSTLLNNREFMKRDNISATKLFDTMRKKRMIVIANYPIGKSVDSHVERMFNIELEVKNLDKSNHQYLVYGRQLQTNPLTGKTYCHLFNSKEGHDLRMFLIKWCNEETFKIYDENKDKFMEKLYKDILQKKKDELMAESVKSNQIRNYGLKPLTQRQAEIMCLISKHGGNISKVAEELEVTPTSISQARKAVFSKGYTSSDFVDGEFKENKNLFVKY